MKLIRHNQSCRKNSYRYEKGCVLFLKDHLGNEIYQTDEKGNEIYPKRGYPFAKDLFGVEYYAKSVDGNEYFPKRKKKCIAIRGGKNGNPVLPREVSGKQKYPEDSRGNQYYLTDQNGEVFPLRDENGCVYYARTNKGIEMIPVRYFNEKNLDKKYHLSIDTAKNVVYIEGGMNGGRTRVIQSCICIVLLNIPSVLSQLLEYLNA